MDDKQIVALYWARNELAITESQRKYAAYCHSIAKNILGSEPDAEEATNDTWLSAWHAIPPHKPMVLSTFLGKLTRRIAIDKWRRNHSEKRGGGQTTLVLEELAEVVSDTEDIPADYVRRELLACITRFLLTCSPRDRGMFYDRYVRMDSTTILSERYGIKEAHVLLILSRTRKKLKAHLEKEGYTL